uniref:Uncharacterized protein n=1 Tax=Cacopsylla melanoneura TaxID=428564 RepID=A0A8D9F3L0_9HEMI
MSNQDFHVTHQNGVTTILHLGFTYANSAQLVDGNTSFRCIRPECQGTIIVQTEKKTGNGNVMFKFIKLDQVHNDLVLCSGRFMRSTMKTNQTSNANPLDLTVYENCIDETNQNLEETVIENALENIIPSADAEEFFVQMKNELDIMLKKFKESRYLNVLEFNKLVRSMFLLLNDKCTQVDKMKLNEETLGQQLLKLQNDLKSAKVKIKDCENRNNLILEDHDEQVKQYAEKQNEQSEIIKNLRRQIEKLSRSPTKNPSESTQIVPTKGIQINATTQYSPVKITPDTMTDQHDVTPTNLIKVLGESQDNVTITPADTACNNKQLTKRTSADNTQQLNVSQHDVTAATLTCEPENNIALQSAADANNRKQIAECFVSINKFMDLEKKVKLLEQSLQGLKNNVKGQQPQLKPIPSTSQAGPTPKATHSKKENHPSIFIVGDGHARNLKETLERKIPRSWTIQSSFNKEANLKAVSDNLIQPVEKCNHLILFAGSNDMFVSPKREIMSSLKKIIEKFSESQMIHLLLVPERYDDVNYNYHINKINEIISDFVKPYQNVITYNTKDIVDSWDYHDNLFIGRIGKIKICSELAKKILGKDKKNEINTQNTVQNQNKSSETPNKTRPSQTKVQFETTKVPKIRPNLQTNKDRKTEHMRTPKTKEDKQYRRQNGRNTLTYHSYESTSRAPRYEDNDMTLSFPHNLCSHYGKRYTPGNNSRRWTNSSYRNSRNFP